MGLEAATIAWISAGISATAAVGGAVMQHKAAGEQKETKEIQLAQQKNEAKDQRMKAMREDRVKRARILQQSEALGLGDSTTSLAAGSQLSANTAAVNNQQSANTNYASIMTNQAQQMADIQQVAQTFSTVGQVSSSIFSAASSGAFGAGAKSGKGK